MAHCSIVGLGTIGVLPDIHPTIVDSYTFRFAFALCSNPHKKVLICEVSVFHRARHRNIKCSYGKIFYHPIVYVTYTLAPTVPLLPFQVISGQPEQA